MAEDKSSGLLVNRNRDLESALPVVDEFYRRVAMNFRQRMVNMTSGSFHLRLASTDVGTLGELINDPEYKSGAVYGMIRVDSTGMPGALILQRTLLTRIIGAMIGDVEGSEVDGGENRPLSPVEQRVGKRIFEELIHQMTVFWPIQVPPDIVLDGVAAAPRAGDRSMHHEEVYVATVDFGPPSDPLGLAALALPGGAFRSLDVDSGSPSARERPKRRMDLERVMPLEVDVVVEIARLRLEVSTLRDMKLGDIIPLGPSRDTVVRVNDCPVMEGQAGQSDGQRSVLIRKKLA